MSAGCSTSGSYLELDAAELARRRRRIRADRDRVLTSSPAARPSIPRIRPAERNATPSSDFFTFDRANPQSIIGMVARARENARGTQETLSVEAWSQVNRLYLYLCSQRGAAAVPSQPIRFYAGDQAGVHPLRRLDPQHPAPRRGLPFPPARPIPGTRRPDQPDPRTPRAGASRRLGPVPTSACELVQWTGLLQELLGVRGVSPHLPRPDRAGRRDPLPGARPRLPPRHAVLRGPLPRVAPRDRRRRRGRGTSARPSGCWAGSTSELRYIDVSEIFERGLLPFLDGIQDACRRVGDEIQQTYFAT